MTGVQTCALPILTKGSPFKLILGFAFPMLLGMLFQQFYNLVDTMIVGKTLGVSALAGVGATGSINFMIIGFCMGICNGFAIPVAQQFGAGKYSELRKYVFNGYICSAVLTRRPYFNTYYPDGSLVGVFNGQKNPIAQVNYTTDFTDSYKANLDRKSVV